MTGEARRDDADDTARPGPAGAPYIFISYRSEFPDKGLASDFNRELTGAGYETFMAAESLRIGDEWPEHVDRALNRCDYFLLLLSDKSAKSEMVTQEVHRAKQLRESRPDKRPLIMPVRVNLPMEQQLNYDLDGYLHRIHQVLWQSDADTRVVLEKILEVIRWGEFGESAEGCDGAAPRPANAPRADGPPLPVAEPEWPGGRVPHDSQFYVARPGIDDECFRHILRPAALLRIRAPRQMGKTSLLARVLNHAKRNGCATGQISFQLVTDETLADLSGLLRYFCFSVGECMGVPDRLEEMWDERRDAFHNSRLYFARHLLPQIDKPFVLGLDEVDRLFPHEEVAEHFFGMLRGWIDSGGDDDELWGKFRVVLVHSTECYIAMSVDQSPFDNIGRGFRLPPFDEAQVADLARRHGLKFDDEAHELFALVDGHPYLTRVALYYVARESKTFREIIDNAHTEAGIFSDHLRRHYWNLSRRPELAAAFKSLVEARARARAGGAAAASVSLDNVPAFKLEGMGLVKPVRNEATVSCELYQRYFEERFRVRR